MWGDLVHGSLPRPTRKSGGPTRSNKGRLAASHLVSVTTAGVAARRADPWEMAVEAYRWRRLKRAQAVWASRSLGGKPTAPARRPNFGARVWSDAQVANAVRLGGRRRRRPSMPVEAPRPSMATRQGYLPCAPKPSLLYWLLKCGCSWRNPQKGNSVNMEVTAQALSSLPQRVPR